MTQEEIINQYKELRQQLGKKPNLRQFRSQTDVTDKILASAFGRNAFTKLVELCGDSPNQFGKEKSELLTILKYWGRLTRKLKMIPTSYEWEDSGNQPTISGIARSHNVRWSEMPIKFYEMFEKHPEWADVLEIINVTEKDYIPELTEAECFVYLMKDLRNNSYKIGISNDAIFREKTLQSQQPKIELIAKKKYMNRKIAGAIEKALHNVYDHKHLRGEWFRLDEEDLKELKITLDD